MSPSLIGESNAHQNQLESVKQLTGLSDIRELDPELKAIENKEICRENSTIELIASENYAHPAVVKALSTPFQNKYSEGSVTKRYYSGCENVDEVESICKQRALKLYRLDPSIWDVNVQSLSGAAANLAVYSGVLGKNGRILGLKLSDGGHLTHGHKVSVTSKFFEAENYRIDPETSLIDYVKLEQQALEFKPKIIVAGTSAYSREIDYARFREICDKVGCYLMADMAHISGLVAGGVMKNDPFEFADIVTTTTHKSLRGPRSAMIFCRKDKENLCQQITSAHFPGLTGGPHNNKIYALALALKLADTEEFREYAQLMIDNARMIGKTLQDNGVPVMTGGTDTHLILVNVTSWSPSKKLNGSHMQSLTDKCGFSINMNSISTDESPFRPSGLRIGSPQITTRGVKTDGARKIGEMIYELLCLGEKIIGECESNVSYIPLATFNKKCEQFADDISTLKQKAASFIEKYPIWNNQYHNL